MLLTNEAIDNSGGDKQWITITDDLFQACGLLRVGELVHDPLFSLMEALHAIEIMEPKMDAGMMCNQRLKFLSLKDGIDRKLIKVDELSSEELLQIMDGLLICLFTWLEGCCLAQTVFICAYLHDVEQVKDGRLRVFCLAILKIVALIKEQIIQAAVFCEEDFQPTSHGFKFANDHSYSDVLQQLLHVFSASAALSAALRESADCTEQMRAEALRQRLHFVHLFLRILLAFSLPMHNTSQRIDAELTEIQALCMLMAHQQFLTAPIGSVMGFEPLLNHRLMTATFPREVQFCSFDKVVAFFQQMFSDMALISATKQRCPDLLQLYNCLTRLSMQQPSILTRSTLALTVLSWATGSVAATMPPAAEADSPSPVDGCMYGGRLPPHQLLASHIRFLTNFPLLFIESMPHLAARLLPSDQHSVDGWQTLLGGFIEHLSQWISRLLRNTCQNRCRQRDIWSALLDQVAPIVEQAAMLDEVVRAVLSAGNATLFKATLAGEGGVYAPQQMGPFSSYVAFWTIRVMLNYVLCGFEANLYAHHELHFVYWYLADKICVYAICTIARLQRFLRANETFVGQVCQSKVGNDGTRRGGGKRLKKHQAQPQWTTSQALVVLQREHERVALFRSLCTGHLLTVFALRRAAVVANPASPFDNEPLRYQLRFKPFVALPNPPYAPYDAFLQQDAASWERESPEALFRLAAKCFGEVKQFLENNDSDPQTQLVHANVQTYLLQLCKGNLIAARLLGTNGQLLKERTVALAAAGGVQAAPGAPPHLFGYPVHSMFFSLKVV